MAEPGRRGKTRRRGYAPRVEALEALRLLEAAPGVAPLVLTHEPPPALEPRGALTLVPPVETVGAAEYASDVDAWDAALGRSDLADWYVEGQYVPEPEAVGLGLSQLDRYLGKAWARAGLGSQQFDDCTQAVHTTMLQNLGRPGFDRMLGTIGREGVTRVINRETEIGMDFFRAVDMVKKRAMRQRSHAALDDRPDLAAPGVSGRSADRYGALHEAIESALDPREAELIRATLDGFSPAEIADQWGLAAKTVSNEKSRAIHKLREVLMADLDA